MIVLLDDAWSARLDRCAKDVRVQVLVVPELELVDVDRSQPGVGVAAVIRGMAISGFYK